MEDEKWFVHLISIYKGFAGRVKNIGKSEKGSLRKCNWGWGEMGQETAFYSKFCKASIFNHMNMFYLIA